MMLGDLPPSSSVTRLSARPALAPISLPTSVEPVNAILSTPGWSTSAAPVSPSPVRTLTHARRDPGLEHQLAEPQRGQRRLLGRLEHDRAAGGERRGELPGRHQQREVPRDDLRRTRRPAPCACSRACPAGGRGSTSPKIRSGQPAKWRKWRDRSTRRRRPWPASPACRCQAPRARRARRRAASSRSARRLISRRPLGGAETWPTGRPRAPRRAAATARSTSSAPAWATVVIGCPVAGSMRLEACARRRPGRARRRSAARARGRRTRGPASESCSGRVGDGHRVLLAGV